MGNCWYISIEDIGLVGIREHVGLRAKPFRVPFLDAGCMVGLNSLEMVTNPLSPLEMN